MKKIVFALAAAVSLSIVQTAQADERVGCDGTSAMVEHSEKWEYYYTRIKERQADIVFDDVISQRIDCIDLPNAIVIAIKLKDVGEDGLPTDAETRRFNEAGSTIGQAIEDSGGIFLGRVFVNGTGQILGLVGDDGDSVKASLREIEKQFKGAMKIQVTPDPKKKVYWKTLYPNKFDRQMMDDLKVMVALNKQGDNSELTRPIQHWVYFSNVDSANKFSQWASKNGYTDVSIDDEYPQEIGVRFLHQGKTDLRSINGHTWSLLVKAEEYDGEYDGWETQVMR